VTLTRNKAIDRIRSSQRRSKLIEQAAVEAAVAWMEDCPLFNAGRALCFPCDAQGHVELDAMSDRARANYFYARSVIGREFATPAVLRLS